MNLLRRVRMILEPSTIDGYSVFRLPVVLFCMATTLMGVSLAFSVTTGPAAAYQEEDPHEQTETTYQLILVDDDGEDDEEQIVVVENSGNKVARGKGRLRLIDDSIHHHVKGTDHSQPGIWVVERDSDDGSKTVHYHVIRAEDLKHGAWVQDQDANELIELRIKDGNTIVQRVVDRLPEDALEVRVSPSRRHIEFVPKHDVKRNVEVIVEDASPHARSVWKFEIDPDVSKVSPKQGHHGIWVQRIDKTKGKGLIEVEVSTDEDAKSETDIESLIRQVKKLRKEVEELRSKPTLNHRHLRHLERLKLLEKSKDSGEGVYRWELRKNEPSTSVRSESKVRLHLKTKPVEKVKPATKVKLKPIQELHPDLIRECILVLDPEVRLDGTLILTPKLIRNVDLILKDKVNRRDDSDQ